MRQIGLIPDGEQAERFADFLRGQGTACSLDADGTAWAVWVHDEDQVAGARRELQSFLADPNHERYRQAREQAQARIRDEYERRKAARRNTVSLRTRWDRPLGERSPVTFGLLALCVVVAVVTRLGGQFLMGGEQYKDIEPILKQLWISPNGRWDAVRSGELWRIWSPIFLHYGWMHILFNALWLRDFGMTLEDRLGSLRLLILVLVIGAVSNILQFEFGATPLWQLVTGKNWDAFFIHGAPWPRSFRFGGMSGVNYGLFGYLWVRGKLDPDSGLGVSSQTVMWMGIWFVVCFTGLVGPIANMAHAGGLATGVALGALAALRRR